jgi:hypothetical protein
MRCAHHGLANRPGCDSHHMSWLLASWNNCRRVSFTSLALASMPSLTGGGMRYLAATSCAGGASTPTPTSSPSGEGEIAVASSSCASARSSGERENCSKASHRDSQSHKCDESYLHVGTAVRVEWWVRSKRVGIGTSHTMIRSVYIHLICSAGTLVTRARRNGV